MKASNIRHLETAGGRILCNRCRAKSKRTGHQCGAPAEVGKQVCRFHGARSRGPRTSEGRARCADAKTIHGRDTRQARQELSEGLTYLKALEELGRLIGLIEGPRSPGRQPGYRSERKSDNVRAVRVHDSFETIDRSKNAQG